LHRSRAASATLTTSPSSYSSFAHRGGTSSAPSTSTSVSRPTNQALCNYTHSRPDASDGALWQSNGPVYNNAAIALTFQTTLSVYALGYLLLRLARPDFVMPEDSDILFELDWMPDYSLLVRGFTDLYGKKPRPPLKD